MARQTSKPSQRAGCRGCKASRFVIVVSDASYHAAYDHCTAKYLEQAGVKAEFVPLPEQGLRGNGHMVMIERNNHEVADFLIGWLGARSL